MSSASPRRSAAGPRRPGSSPPRRPAGAAVLLADIRGIIAAARCTVSRGVNAALVWTNFEIGRRIVQHEQGGKARARYAAQTLKSLAAMLTAEFGRGYSVDNLTLMRRFYLAYANSETLSRISGKGAPAPVDPNRQTLSARLRDEIAPDIVAQPRVSASLLSWSHYVLLMGIEDGAERRFYEVEAAEQNWSLRELRRQYDASLFERLALSRDKDAVRALAEKGQTVERPEDVLKDPYVLEFLDLAERPAYSETELEAAIIARIEHFLLELGKGFLFEARQRRFTFADEHFFVDLVFYNRLLRCYVLIDLKLGRLTHQDLGQMQMYVNYFDRFMKTPEESQTVGIILCKRRNDALVRITLPEASTVFARRYQLYLPTKAELRAQLLARDLPPMPEDAT